MEVLNKQAQKYRRNGNSDYPAAPLLVHDNSQPPEEVLNTVGKLIT
jgi:hypothetical protein